MRINDIAISTSDCFSDLLCAEDSGSRSSESRPPFSDDEEEQCIARFIQDECNYYFLRPIPLISSARADSVSWILKVRAYYGFHALTAYLAINYFDHFLSTYRLPESNGSWTLQLLSVACLSLAAKMEEPLVPLLPHFQVEAAKYVFRSTTIQRMELLVLGVLNWRLQTVTPFSFISFFTRKIDTKAAYINFIILRSTDIILSNLQEASCLEYRPSSVAASAVLWAATEIPKLCLVTPDQAQSWCHGLSKVEVLECYKVMQNVSERNKAVKMDRTISDCSLSPSQSLCSSSSSKSPPYGINTIKRRKLSSSSWVDVDLDDDDQNKASVR